MTVKAKVELTPGNYSNVEIELPMILMAAIAITLSLTIYNLIRN